MRKKRVPICIGLFTVLILYLLQRLVMPKYQSTLPEGALISEYYASPKDHDLVFLGDCEVYESFSPAVLAEETGLQSFVRGSAAQRIWQSYYLMEDTLRYETPDYFVFNVLSLIYEEPAREEYNRMTLEGMRWSKSKLCAIQASMNPEEHLITYLFPLLRYHDRWSQLTFEDFTCLFTRKPVSEDGYLPQYGVRPAENIPEGKPLADYTLPARSLDYLDRMRTLCEEQGASLILIKAPSLYPAWYPEWDKQVEEYAHTYGLSYLNFIRLAEDAGLDYSLDTYDAGQHLNASGAEKLTRYFGGWLISQEKTPEKEDLVP